MKPLLVGEVNPYGVNPKYALYPLPAGASGSRLCTILGMDVMGYVDSFQRKNLCYGEWSDPIARTSAELLKEGREYEWIILLGAKVCAAFGVEYKPFHYIGRYLILPHPSGRNLVWNESINRERARRLVEDVLTWRPIQFAPHNATEVRVKMDDGSIHGEVHWASNLAGEEQPPFQGWFVPGARDSEGRIKDYVSIPEPVMWQDMTLPCGRAVQGGVG